MLQLLAYVVKLKFIDPTWAVNLTSEGNWPQRKWGVVIHSTGNGCFESEKITTAFWREDQITETKRSLRDHLKVLSLISKQAPMSQPGGYSRDSFVLSSGEGAH